MTYDLTMAGEALQLRADRSLWWPAQRILFIADVHAGKTEHLQRAGLRIPSGNLQSDLQRLESAITILAPARVIILGDLFHSDINTEWQIFSDWLTTQTCSIELVRGNHDRFITDQTFAVGGLIVHEEDLRIAPFRLRHHPVTGNTDFVLCGHLHPVHYFREFGGSSLRLPCFVAEPQQLVLPAFGSFTGGFTIKKTSDKILVGTGNDFESLIAVGL